jgi:hypothetical protein
MLTLLMVAGAFLLLRLVAGSWTAWDSWTSCSPSQRLLGAVTLTLALWHLLFHQLADRYILVFLPYILILIGSRCSSWVLRFRKVVVGVALVLLALSMLWTRAWLDREEAEWKAGEYARVREVRPEEISASWAWVGYHSFQEFRVGQAVPAMKDLDEEYGRWFLERQARVPYVITYSLEPPPRQRWSIVAEFPFRSFFLGKRLLYLVKRD